MRRILSVLVLLAALVAVPTAHAWTWPTAGPVLRPFSLGPDSYAGGQHRGVDIAAELGSPVLAPAAGTVSFVGSIPGGGRAITIQTPDGYAVTLLQLGSTSILRGSVVTEGAVVGVVGESVDAVTSAPHVHLGVRVAADPDGYVDPLGLLPALLPQPVPASPPLIPEPQPASEPALAVTPAEVPVSPVAADPPVVSPEPALASTAAVLGTPVESAPAVEPPVLITVAAPPPDRVAEPADASAAALVETLAAAQIASPNFDEVVAATAGEPVSAPPVVERVAVTLPAVAGAGAGESMSVAHPQAADDAAGATLPAPTPTIAAVASAPKFRAISSLPAGSPPAASAPRSTGRESVSGTLPVPAAETGPRRELPLGLAFAGLAALVGVVALACRRRPGAGGPARIMGGDDRSRTAEDPRRSCVAVRERTAPHRPRGRVWRPLGHLRPVSPASGQRRADGERDGRARHPGDGGRGRGRSLAA